MGNEFIKIKKVFVEIENRGVPRSMSIVKVNNLFVKRGLLKIIKPKNKFGVFATGKLRGFSVGYQITAKGRKFFNALKN